MNIKTIYDPKPIPIRGFDWTAYDDDTHDLGSIEGHGATEEEAKADFWERWKDHEAWVEAKKIDAAKEELVRRELRS